MRSQASSNSWICSTRQLPGFYFGDVLTQKMASWRILAGKPGGPRLWGHPRWPWREHVRSDRSLQWRLGDPLRWWERGIVVMYYPLVAVASLQEGGDTRSGEVLQFGVGKNLEGVSIRGYVVSLIDQCGENTPVKENELDQQSTRPSTCDTWQWWGVMKNHYHITSSPYP